MNPWRNYPFVRIGIFFALGAGLVLTFPDVHLPPVAVCCTLTIAVLAFSFFPFLSGSYRLRWIIGVLVLSSLFLSGAHLTKIHEPSFDFTTPPGDQESFICLGKITEQPVLGGRTFRVFAELFTMDSSQVVHRTGPAVISAEHDPRFEAPGIGDLILISSFVKPLRERDNPGGFDKKRWYRIKGIILQAYVKKGDWKVLRRGGDWSVRRWSHQIRGNLMDILRASGLSGQEFAVASALLLGYVHELDRDLMRGYSATGAMHVLSVSGMHVGVVYLFLEFVLGFMNRKRSLVLIKAGIISLFIWFYAFLTGLSPPVMRAAMMLSMIVVGKALRRNPEVLNIVAASFLAQLMLNPLMLGDIGFQFSYLAVLGIVVMHQPLYDTYVTSNVVGDKLWALVVVSVVAQAATFPLGLYAFHQFPNYFLLTNLVVVPFSNFIIYTGILVLAVGTIPWIGPFFGMILSWMIRILNSSILFIGSLPGAVTGGVSITLVQTLLLFAMVGFVFLFLTKKKTAYLLLFLGCIVVFQAEMLRQSVISRTRTEFVVYQSTGNTMADFIYGDRNLLIRNNPNVPVHDFTRAMLMDHWRDKGIRWHSGSFIAGTGVERPDWSHNMLPVGRQGDFFLFARKRIYFLGSTIPPGMNGYIKVDYLVIGGAVKNDLRDISAVVESGMIIIDSSVKRWRCRKWMTEAEKLKIPVYSVADSGAFITCFR